LIYTLLDDFKKSYEVYGDRLIIDKQKLKPGLYLKINHESGEIEHLIVEKKDEGNENIALYNWFRERDFYSGLITMNKAIDTTKKIHSNNYFTVFIKKKTLFGKDKISNANLINSLDNYYDNLLSNKLKGKKEVEMKIKTDEILGGEIDPLELDKIKTFIKNEIEKIITYSSDYEDQIDKEGYIKIFIETEDLKDYIREGNRYYFRKIFNSNNDNIEIDNGIYGLSGSNMGLNSKKDFLEHRTMKCKVPFRITAEDALITYKYFIWLKSEGYGNKAINDGFDYKSELSQKSDTVYNKIILKSGVNTDSVRIEDFDIVPKFENEISNLRINNIFNSDKFQDVSIDTRFKLLSEINRKLFFNNIKFFDFLNSSDEFKINYEPKKESKVASEIYEANKGIFFNYLNKGFDQGMDTFTKKFGIDLIAEQLTKHNRFKARDGFNLYEMLLRIFTEEGEDLKNNLNELIKKTKEKLSSENNHYEGFDSIEEYSFVAGQLSYFLLSKSEKHEKNHDMVKPFLSRNTSVKMNDELRFWFEKYSHNIYMNSKKFNKAMAWTFSFEDEKSVDKNMFLAGYLANNIFYEGREVKNDSEE